MPKSVCRLLYCVAGLRDGQINQRELESEFLPRRGTIETGQCGQFSHTARFVFAGFKGERKSVMPQFEQLKKGYARVRILPKDATRAYLMLMRQSSGRLKVLPNDLYELDEAQLQSLTDNKIEFERIDGKPHLTENSSPKSTEEEQG
jgi:hypothetical protein